MAGGAIGGTVGGLPGAAVGAAAGSGLISFAQNSAENLDVLLNDGIDPETAVTASGLAAVPQALLDSINYKLLKDGASVA